MAKYTLLKDWREYKEGEVVEFKDIITIDLLTANGYISPVMEKKIPEGKKIEKKDNNG